MTERAASKRIGARFRNCMIGLSSWRAKTSRSWYIPVNSLTVPTYGTV